MTLTRFYSLIDIQARMALRADASRFFLGYLWWILEPLLFVLVFYVVFDVVLGYGREEFLLFLICGKLPFQWFSSSINFASNSIVASRGIVGQLDIAKAIFPMARVQEGLYKQAAVFGLLIITVLFYGRTPSVTWLWLVPLVLTEYALIVSCALIGSVLVCFVRDFTMLISLAMIFLMFVSGVFWDVRALADPDLTQLLLTINPMTFLLDGYRQVLMYNQSIDILHITLLLVASIMAAVIVLALMARIDKALAVRVLAE